MADGLCTLQYGRLLAIQKLQCERDSRRILVGAIEGDRVAYLVLQQQPVHLFVESLCGLELWAGLRVEPLAILQDEVDVPHKVLVGLVAHVVKLGADGSEVHGPFYDGVVVGSL